MDLAHPEQISDRDMPCKSFDFTGVKGTSAVNFTTYKQCIQETPETSTLGQSGSTFAIFAKKFRD